MPIYAFACSACGHRFERLQKIADADPETCPACGATQVQRQLTAPAFRLAGSGWYETDFKKDGQRNLARKDEGAAGAGGAAQPATAESKPAAAESKPAGHACGSGCGCA